MREDTAGRIDALVDGDTAGRIDALVLDFDGLILDTESVEYQSLTELYQQYGLDLPFEQWRRTVGSVSTDWLALMQAQSGVPLDETEVRRALLQRQRQLAAAKPLQPGVEAVLRTAARHGVAVGVASSADRERLRPELARRGLLDRFGAVVTRDDVAAVKPAPEPYLRALAELGASAQRSVAFEDSAHGVAAATSAGMRCVAVPSAITADQDFARASLVVERIDQVDLEALMRGRLVALAP